MAMVLPVQKIPSWNFRQRESNDATKGMHRMFSDYS